MEVQSVTNPARSEPSAQGPDASVDQVQRPKEVKKHAPETTVLTPRQNEEEQTEERKEVKQVIEAINTVLENSGNHIKFVEHEAAEQMMVQIRDNNTDEVIRTVPSKELLDLAAKISDMVGVLIDSTT
jgi:flagellar protein FlaG